MRHDGFRIPDRVFAVMAMVVLALTWGMLMWAWPDLPERIPTHFGISGAPDAFSDKSFWSVFLPPLIVTIMGAAFAWLYRHPQYSHIPGTLFMSVVPEPEKTMLFRIIRHYLVMLYLLMTLVFADIAINIISVGFGVTKGFQPWMMLFLICFILLTSVMYTVWLTRFAKVAMERLKEGETPAPLT